ncbi:hypothetical protein [Glaciibacter psychrotolerans]|uniref:Uncharacterized protein n=1 Tax=Glaciibacter psychrotolerans TaxID=670054 RepID=A0A7Z0J836_9MICO|nr:hypothetical protein [Leifsonia psychrotolerans]NYJ21623.1 hypothetical protein [Leifsonia psychrotolerans]
MPSDPEGLWPQPPDPTRKGRDEEREIDDVDEIPDVEEAVVGEPERGIDADDRIVEELDEFEP